MKNEWPKENSPIIPVELLPESALLRQGKPTEFVQIVKKFLKQKQNEGLSDTSLEAYHDRIKSFLVFAQNLPVTASLVDRYADHMKAKKMSNAQINCCMQIVKAVLKWAYCMELIREDIVRRIRFKSLPAVRRTSIVSYEQYLMLRDSAKNPKVRLALIIAYWTGLRVSDIQQLRWDAIDFQAGIIRVVAKKTSRYKTEATIPMVVSGELYQTLKELWKSADGTYVIPHENTFNACECLKELIVNLIKKCGIKGISPHSFRRTFISRAINSGIPTEIAMKMTGILNYQTMRHYVVIKESSIIDAGMKIQEIMSEANTGRL